MKTLAFIVLFLNLLSIVLYPAVIGQERKPYSYSGFIANLIEAVLIALLCSRVIGWI